LITLYDISKEAQFRKGKEINFVFKNKYGTENLNFSVWNEK